uniref:Uncharacterized protein n=1 Tax=Kalanchoe fedtschenkoi TaxID=63787 RepID=A0A7N0T7B9_KALFE
MDSVSPPSFGFQDLNLIPNSPTSPASATASTSTPNILIQPKLEPKLEPLDYSHLPYPPGHDSDPSTNRDHNNVYSEFYRVSELFRTAFAQRMGNDEGVLDSNTGAIVPVSEDNSLTPSVQPPRRRTGQRSSELVRISDIGLEDQRYFRENLRTTRMVYDSLRIFFMAEDEKGNGLGLTRRKRCDLKAATLMRDRGLWINQDKRIVGSIPGVLVGDMFSYRMELCVVGLHGQPQAGIDYLSASMSSNGEPIATSIIASGGYEDDEDSGEVLVYTGHGGQDKLHRQCSNQKLEGGNLALERSMHYNIEVRVIRGFKYQGGVGNKVYVYDGLYKIVDTWFDIGKSGFGVYKFKLVRIEGQPDMGSTILRYAENLRMKPLSARPTGYLSLDMSRKKESVPVFLYNDIDHDHEPLYFDYLPRTVFPPFVFQQASNASGCDCMSSCEDGCLCAIKNGGDFAYDQSGTLLRGKPVVFECGPHCTCPPTCRNRVTQHGVRKRLEVFRSTETGWGVRSLDLIHAGSFICEYAGVVLTTEQAAVFRMNGDNLVYPSQFTERWSEWGDLSKIFTNYEKPTYPSIPPIDFAMDVSRMRNVSCYMSHSSAPNVMMQLVLYDHSNFYFPHLMIFAMENVPPLRELSLDYGVADEWTGKLAICN